MIPPVTSLIAAFALAMGGINAASAQTPADPGKLSAGFWNDWTALKSDGQYKALQEAVDCGCTVDPGKPVAQTGTPQKPNVYSIAISKPDQAAKMLNDAARNSKGADTDRAMATVIQMRIPPKTLEAAAPMVAPEARARVETFRANLTTGIPGLPGIYLGNDTPASRPSVPSGFTPVAGRSLGCPSR